MRPLKLAMFPLLAGLAAGQAQTSDPTDFFQGRVQPIFPLGMFGLLETRKESFHIRRDLCIPWFNILMMT